MISDSFKVEIYTQVTLARAGCGGELEPVHGGGGGHGRRGPHLRAADGSCPHRRPDGQCPDGQIAPPLPIVLGSPTHPLIPLPLPTPQQTLPLTF